MICIYHPTLHELLPKTFNQIIKIREYAQNLSPSLIESITILGNHNTHQQTIWPILPDLNPHLIVKFFKNGKQCFHLTGPRSKAIYIRRFARSLTIVIRFAPGVLRNFYNVSLESLCDCSLDLSQEDAQLLPVSDQIFLYYEEGKVNLIIELLLHYLHTRYQKYHKKGTHHFIREAGSVQKVNNWAKVTGFSERGLQKACYQHLGLNPKKILQIQRINYVIKHLENYNQDSWTSMALSAGYYDQSHFIEEFGRFFGNSPERWFNQYFKA